MKTNNKIRLLTIVSLVFAGNLAKGQSTTAANSYVSTYYLGWGNTSGDLPFKVNNTTWMTLQNTTGNFGLGTTSPTNKLHLSGETTQFPASIRIDATSYSTSRRAAIFIDNWLVGQDYSGNTTKDFFIYDGTAGLSRFYINTSGSVGIGTTSPLAKLHVNNGAVLVDGTTGSTPTSGAGTRMMWVPAKGAFRAGAATSTEWDNANIGANSVAMGNTTTASGSYSVAFGDNTTASATGSVAFGEASTASSAQSVAFGNSSTASGGQSEAFGYHATSSGSISTAFGDHATSQAYNSFVIGAYNVVSGTIGSWVSTEPLFVIGNGAPGATSNALTVLKNGNVGIGTASPGYQLELSGQIKIAGGSPGAGKILTSDAAGVASWSTAAPTGAWSTTGNSSTVDGTNFIGTTDDIPFNIRVNNQKAGRIDDVKANAFFGYEADNYLTTGHDNAAFGNSAMINTSTGFNNTAIGSGAMYGNTTGSDNCAIGDGALAATSTASDNTAVGNGSLHLNTGDSNTAVGRAALTSNTSATYNCAVGDHASSQNTGTGTTSVGYEALLSNTTGSYNSSFGYMADVNSGTYTYACAIGAGAVVLGNSRIQLGNTTTDVYQTSGNYLTSDGRFKANVSENVKGLAFINKLRPVTYNLNTKELDDFSIKNMPDSIKTKHQQGMDFSSSMKKIHSGFIAQEVEVAAKEVGFTCSIIHHPDNDDDTYAVAYAEIVVPLVKAVQELSKTADSLKTNTAKQDSINKSLAAVNKSLQAQIDKLAAGNNTNIGSALNNNSSVNNNTNGNSISATDVKLTNGQSIVLEQNVPNPFAEQTTINYFLPDDVSKAQMLFYNSDGKLIQSVDLAQRGKGQLNVFASDLTNGMYTYTLVVDGKIIETKKMIKQ